MKSSFIAIFFCLLLSISGGFAAGPNIWPQPAKYTSGSQTIAVDSNSMRISSSSTGVTSALNSYFNKWLLIAFPRRAATSEGVNSIRIYVRNTNAMLQMGVNESYTLAVSSSSITIDAGTTFAAYHALQTLSQLIVFDFTTRSYVIGNAPWSIKDSPRFPHRSLLIDTGRHFLPVATILMVLDSMHYSKLNSLHWHMVDGQSFPFIPPSMPELGRIGAFSQLESYTTYDVTAVVSYATSLGIRVVVEIDSPFHFGGVCNGDPLSCLIPQCKTSINYYPMGIAFENPYSTMQKILSDLAQIVPDALMHLGGDVGDPNCWKNDSDTAGWMSANSMSLNDAYRYAMQRVQIIAENLGRTPIQWHEAWQYFGTSLDKDIIVEQRVSTPSSSQSMTASITNAGNRVIWGDSSRWYLDKLDVTWSVMYSAEPCTGLTSAQCSLVIGGEACMWGETVDPSNIFQTIWPRAAAIAERLWSPSTVTSVTDATSRMARFRCLLNARGIPAAPMTSITARSAPTGPGSCTTQ